MSRNEQKRRRKTDVRNQPVTGFHYQKQDPNTLTMQQETVRTAYDEFMSNVVAPMVIKFYRNRDNSKEPSIDEIVKDFGLMSVTRPQPSPMSSLPPSPFQLSQPPSPFTGLPSNIGPGNIPPILGGLATSAQTMGFPSQVAGTCVFKITRGPNTGKPCGKKAVPGTGYCKAHSKSGTPQTGVMTTGTTGVNPLFALTKQNGGPTFPNFPNPNPILTQNGGPFFPPPPQKQEQQPLQAVPYQPGYIRLTPHNFIVDEANKTTVYGYDDLSGTGLRALSPAEVKIAEDIGFNIAIHKQQPSSTKAEETAPPPQNGFGGIGGLDQDANAIINQIKSKISATGVTQ